MLTFNSYPRSANVFLFTLASQYTDEILHADHNSKLYYNKDIFQVATFRNPIEAISSLIYKQRDEAFQVHKEVDNVYGVEDGIKNECKAYINFVEDALINKDHIIINNFNLVKNNSDKNIREIFNYFNIKIKEDKEKFNIKEYMLNNELLTPGDGHLPREKNKHRLFIEDFVQKSGMLKEALDAYNSLEYTIF